MSSIIHYIKANLAPEDFEKCFYYSAIIIYTLYVISLIYVPKFRHKLLNETKKYLVMRFSRLAPYSITIDGSRMYMGQAPLLFKIYVLALLLEKTFEYILSSHPK